jgi:PST family polysaccharide transporter
MANSSKSELWLLKYLPHPIAQLLTIQGQRRVVAENAAWLVAERFMRLVLGVFVGAWVARYLGPSQFGQLSYVLAFLAFFQAVAGLGIDSIIVRDLARNPEIAGEILGSTIVMRTVAGLMGWFAATVSMAFVEKSDPNLILITAIIGSGLIFQVADVFDIWFQSQSF